MISKHKKSSKKISENIKEIIPERVSLSAVDIWFQDEARIGQQGTITRMWAPKGERPRVIRQQQFINAYIFGATCPAQGYAEAFVSPYANTQAMLVNLEQISKSVPKSRHAVVVLDGASWHTTKEIKTFENLSLLPLPAYSPELNPIEQVWQWMRNHHLSNRCFEDYQDIVDSSCKAWNKFAENVNRVKELCYRAWAIIDHQSL